MNWLVSTVCATALAVSGCHSECSTCGFDACATCTAPGSPCSTEDASAYGWVSCGAKQIFRTCTCTNGTWDCGDCPDADVDAASPD